MDDIYKNLRQRIQIIISTNQYKHPHLNDLNLHNCHPHIFPYQPPNMPASPKSPEASGDEIETPSGGEI